jgi:hypothetical protein
MKHKGADKIGALQKPVPRDGMGFFIMGQHSRDYLTLLYRRPEAGKRDRVKAILSLFWAFYERI